MRPCDPDYAEIHELQLMLMQLENPSCVFGYDEGDMPAPELAAAKQTILDRLDELLAFQKMPFNGYLSSIK